MSACRCRPPFGDPDCPVHGYKKVAGSPSVAVAAPIVERLTDSHAELKLACYTLLDNIKNRFPDEDRRLWKCGDFARIAKLIDFR